MTKSGGQSPAPNSGGGGLVAPPVIYAHALTTSVAMHTRSVGSSQLTHCQSVGLRHHQRTLIAVSTLIYSVVVF